MFASFPGSSSGVGSRASGDFSHKDRRLRQEGIRGENEPVRMISTNSGAVATGTCDRNNKLVGLCHIKP